MDSFTGQWVVVYGSIENPVVYATVYTHDDLVLECGYARLAHPESRLDVRALPAVDVARAAGFKPGT